MGVEKLVVEGDSKVVIEAIKEPLEECPNDTRNYIQECKEFFKAFDHICLQHANRSNNKVANLVARTNIEHNDLSLALGYIPKDIQSAITQESTPCMNQ